MIHSSPRTVLLALLLLASVSFVACDTNLEQTNPNELQAENFYETGPQALAAVNAVYANLQTLGAYVRRYYFNYDLLAGETVGLGSLAPEMQALRTRSYSPSNTSLSEMWDSFYRGIHRANLVIANVPDTEQQITDEERARYIAEARFLRAYYYHNLVTLWGGVPLFEMPGTQADLNEGRARASADEVFALIFADLEAAAEALPAKSDYAEADFGRATQGAALALAGKAHLFRGEYSEAAEAFQRVVDSGEYQLVDDYFSNFTVEAENNDESIFEIQFAVEGGTNQWATDGSGISEVTFRAQEYGFKAWRNVVPSPRLLEEYEEDDPRYDANFYSPCDTYNNGQNTIYTPNDCPPPEGVDVTVPDDLPSWRKYQNYYKQADEDFAASGINFRAIRYADVLLGLAEARAETGDLASAIDLTNQVRQRPSVDMPPYPTDDYPVSSTAEIVDAIYHERAVEFAGEQVYYTDLLRRPDYFEAWDEDVQLPTQLLLPIPQGEIDNNNALSSDDQNPGY